MFCFRILVLQWRTLFLSGNSEILHRRRSFLVKKRSFTSETCFYNGGENIYQEIQRFYIEKVKHSILLQKPTFVLEETFYQENIYFTLKTRFSSKKYYFSSETQFCSENDRFNLETKRFLSKIRFYCEK